MTVIVDNKLPQRPNGGTAGAGKRAGATTAELAVVAPFVFMIILGIIEVGRGLMVTHLLNNAAQAGCRVGIIEGKATSDINAVVLQALQTGGISGDSVTVLVNDGNADASSANSGDEITVKITVPVSKVSWVPGIKFLTGSLGGQYTLRRE
jgi:Flp pilus assembly protein TadG